MRRGWPSSSRSLTAGVHYDTDEYGRDVELTDAGIEHASSGRSAVTLHDGANLALLTELNCALHAHVLLRRDVDYIVRDGRVELVDEFTGRVVRDRHWPDGLQAALEAKEGLARRTDGRILGSMTLQRFLRGYPRLCGMTGTARPAAEELAATYGLDVVVMPTHRAMIRVDRDDVVFTHREAKERAIVEEIRDAHATGRPVLVGTASVSESEALARALAGTGVACEVLNAKNDEEEAGIIAAPGRSARSPSRPTWPDAAPTSGSAAQTSTTAIAWPRSAACYVIGTNRHESRRVDLQLRGRAGRQGDPGESRFFVSLEDDLLVRYGIAELIPARFVPPTIRRARRAPRRPARGRARAAHRRGAELRDPPDARALRGGRRNSSATCSTSGATAVLSGEDAPDVWAHERRRRARARRGGGRGRGRRPPSGRSPSAASTARGATISPSAPTCARASTSCGWAAGIRSRTSRRSDPSLRAARGRGRRRPRSRRSARCASWRAGSTSSATGLKAPSSTWTYLVNDDPFKNRLGALLTGPGGATVAIYAAAMLMPLFLLWGSLDRWFRRGRR